MDKHTILQSWDGQSKAGTTKANTEMSTYELQILHQTCLWTREVFNVHA